MIVETKQNDVWFRHTTYDGDLTTAVVIHIPTGYHATGHARRNIEDPYDKSLGERLAYFRALERVSKKIAKELSK